MTDRNQIQAVQSVKKYTTRNTRRLFYGTLGNNAGTVDHATRTDWVYLRLHGDSNQVVEAYAAASFPHVAEIVVDVELVQKKGAPYYQVLGVSSGIAYTGAGTWAGTIGDHAEQHQRRDRDTGGRDPLDVYNRALVNLRARAQAVPNLTCYVERGFYSITSFKEFAGGNSPAFTAPSGAFSTQRWDLLYLGNDDALHVLQGTAAPINPVYPTVPSNCIPIAYVILSNSSTAIVESMITDARTILSSNQATATAHNLLSAVHTDTLTAAVVDGDVIIGNVTPAWSRLAISVPAAGTRNMLGVDNGELRPSWKADTIYSLVSGVRPFTGTVGGVTPVASTDLATKGYVDLAVSSLRLDEFFASTASDIGGIYYVMDDTPAGAGTVVSAAITSNTTTNIFNFATLSGEPHLDRLLVGVYDIHAHLLKTGNRTITCYAELYKRVGAAETLLGTSSTTPALTAVDAFYDLYMTIATEVPLNLTDRLVLKWYAISANPAGDTTVTMTVGGTADPHMSIIVDPVELHTIFVPYTGAIHDVTLGTHTLTAAQLTATSTAPSVVLTDTTALAKSLTIAVDSNLAQFRESAAAANSLLVLDLANSRMGFGVQPSVPVDFEVNVASAAALYFINANAGGGGAAICGGDGSSNYMLDLRNYQNNSVIYFRADSTIVPASSLITILGGLQLNLNAAALPAVLAGTLLQIGGADGSASRFLFDAFASSGQVAFRRANNTAASPTAVAANDSLGSIAGFGYYSGVTSAYTTTSRAIINLIAAENWTSTAQGTRIQFGTVAAGTATTPSYWLYVMESGNIKIGGTAVRGTTEGAGHLDIFNGTDPAGTLTNGVSLYSTGGELKSMDAAGNSTLLSPHDKQGYWVYHSKNTVTGKVLHVDMERMMKAINDEFGWDFIKEYVEA